ncbi:caspase family protein [Flammeovirga sp. SubArs3]|uniref:caspase family protein n=1 Tax=Flammeovirga sp. SubArs3 TaxID=2995316 RepID=UPI00248C2B7D|nr:caspase family protein [Flammeovirga sp. SubArs3]
MRSLILLLLILISAQKINAQKSIAILPYTQENESFCDSYFLYNNRVVVQSIEEVFRYNGFNVINTYAPMMEIKSKNSCDLSNKELRHLLLGRWQNVYVDVSYKFNKTVEGNYLDLYLLVKDATSGNTTVAFKKTSSTRFSYELKSFVSEIMNAYFSTFLEEYNWAKSSGKNIDLSTLNIPSIAPATPKKTTSTTTNEVVVPISKSKEEKTVDNYPLSDVDKDIPSWDKVNKDAVAVIIGNKNYRHNDVPKVDYAINDAKTMKEYLVKMYGFQEGNIIYLEDATQADFNAVFGIKGNGKGKLFNYVKPNASDVFVYYSGHGAPNPETQQGYFVPVDTDPSLIQFNGYALSTFYENLGQVPYKSLTVVIDACFSGSSDGGMLLKSISPVFIKTENKVLKDDKAVIFSSAASEQVSSWYDENYHSMFTYFFLKGLQGAADKNKDKKITVEEMKNYLSSEVSYMARRLHNRTQTPETIGNLNKTLYSN